MTKPRTNTACFCYPYIAVYDGRGDPNDAASYYRGGIIALVGMPVPTRPTWVASLPWSLLENVVMTAIKK